MCLAKICFRNISIYIKTTCMFVQFKDSQLESALKVSRTRVYTAVRSIFSLYFCFEFSINFHHISSMVSSPHTGVKQSVVVVYRLHIHCPEQCVLCTTLSASSFPPPRFFKPRYELIMCVSEYSLQACCFFQYLTFQHYSLR